MCVTVFASQPSLSIPTEITQRMRPPAPSLRPTVMKTSRRSRRRSSSVFASGACSRACSSVIVRA